MCFVFVLTNAKNYSTEILGLMVEQILGFFYIYMLMPICIHTHIGK